VENDQQNKHETHSDDSQPRLTIFQPTTTEQPKPVVPLAPPPPLNFFNNGNNQKPALAPTVNGTVVDQKNASFSNKGAVHSLAEKLAPKTPPVFRQDSTTTGDVGEKEKTPPVEMNSLAAALT